MMLLLLNNTNNMYNRDHIMSKMTSKGYKLCFYVLWMWFLKFEKTVTLGYFNRWRITNNGYLNLFSTILNIQIRHLSILKSKVLSYKGYNFSFVMKKMKSAKSHLLKCNSTDVVLHYHAVIDTDIHIQKRLMCTKSIESCGYHN